MPFSALYLYRITQLINKTNQFNLTTQRMTPAQVQRVASDPGYLTFYVRLTDRFGDNGLISALIGKIEGKVLSIELWVMSCRVLKRGVERALFDGVLEACRHRGLTEVRGTYLPTEKNELVKSLYPELGMTPAPSSRSGAFAYRLVVPARAAATTHHIAVDGGVSLAPAKVQR
jgi:FkbH-like protein